jgi:hypothetical protein
MFVQVSHRDPILSRFKAFHIIIRYLYRMHFIFMSLMADCVLCLLYNYFHRHLVRVGAIFYFEDGNIFIF